MPPRAKTSKGCYSCRRKKVKCDEERPQCRRCVRAGKLCPGFPKLDVFLSMNHDFAPSKSQPVHQLSQTPKLPALQPTTDWEACAASYFLRNYVVPSTSKIPVYLGFLPEFIKRKEQSQCLKDSFAAVSMTSLAGISSMCALQYRANQLYGKALASTRMALQQRPKDDASLLASIFLLHKYDTLNDYHPQADIHQTAMVRLLQGWPPQGTGHGLEDNLLHTVVTKIQLGNLDGRSSWANGTNTVSARLTVLEAPALWVLVQDAAKCSREIRSWILRSNLLDPPTLMCLEGLLEWARSIEQQLITWEKGLSWNKRYRTVKLFAQDSDSQGGYHFRDYHEGARWIGYWTTRINMLRCIQDGMAFTRPYTSHESPLTEKDINVRMLQVANDICASAPFMLGEINSRGEPSFEGKGLALGAYFLTRALDVVNQVPCLPPDQRRWTHDTLLKIRSCWGVGAATRARAKWQDVYGHVGRPAVED